jgi:hypothetical protein
VNPDPFEALGLPARPDLDDEEVRAAWREVAAATHPDRPDGGDLARYTQASAAYAELRTPWDRGEAYADAAERAERAGGSAEGSAGDADTAPLPAIPGEAWPAPATLWPPPSAGRWRPLAAGPWRPLAGLGLLPARIRRGRPLRLLIRAGVAAGLCLAVLALIPGQPAAPADVGGLIVWFVLTGRRDLAPRPER